jgi:nucleoside-diphosphate-sugar epimerase
MNELIESMKRILILGATGRTGLQTVEYALSKGYEVTALVRSTNKIKIKSDKLKLVAGTPENIDDVRTAMEGCEAVISTLNNPRSSDLPWGRIINSHNLMTDCMRNVVKVMKEIKIRRVVLLSAAGVGESFSLIPFYIRWMITATNLRVAYEDHNNQEELLSHSGLDWTAVRPVGLTNSDKIKPISIDYTTKPGKFISRKAVAKFMVDILETTDFIKKSPLISEKKNRK